MLGLGLDLFAASIHNTKAAIVFATLDPTKLGTGVSLSNGNLTATCAGNDFSALATIAKTAGKWYWEVTFVSGTNITVGIGDILFNLNTYLGADAHSVSLEALGHNLYGTGATGTTLTGVTNVGNTVGIGLDMGAGTLSFWGTGGVALGIGFTGITGTKFPGVTLNAASVTVNFGASPFLYIVPTGYNSGVY